MKPPRKRTGTTGPLTRDTTRVILDCISDGVFTIDYDWQITSFNRAAEEITGIPREKAMGRFCWDVFRSDMCETDCALKRTMAEGRPHINNAGYIITAHQKKVPISVSTSLLIDRNGDIIGGVETFRDLSVVEALRRELTGNSRIGDIVTSSRSMKKILSILPQVAESGASVLIEGETGTGKELLARTLHHMSPRKNNPFVAINCGALPDTLLESELFGYRKGAFTHAVKDKPGQFSLAHGGTLFLDEIGDTSPAFQVRLLRVLQEHEYVPLGGVCAEKTDIRLIAATNRSLSDMVAAQKFRQDLFYRIHVVRLTLPPLRQRMEDIPLLVDRFVSKLNLRQGKSIQGVDASVMTRLLSHDFPGNIRELENIIEHAFVLCPGGIITPEHLPALRLAENTVPEGLPADPVHDARVRAIRDALVRNNYNRNAAARELGIHKTTLFRHIRKLGIVL